MRNIRQATFVGAALALAAAAAVTFAPAPAHAADGRLAAGVRDGVPATASADMSARRRFVRGYRYRYVRTWAYPYYYYPVPFYSYTPRYYSFRVARTPLFYGPGIAF